MIASTGGARGVRDLGGPEAALARPLASFGGHDLYPDPVSKAAAILESIVMNRPFVDGNKRAGYALSRLVLITFDMDIHATEEEEYELVIQVATGQLSVEGITSWLRMHVVKVG